MCFYCNALSASQLRYGLLFLIKNGRPDTGLKLLNSTQFCFLGIGVISATLKCLGISPVAIDVFMICSNTGSSWSICSLSTDVGMGSNKQDFVGAATN